MSATDAKLTIEEAAVLLLTGTSPYVITRKRIDGVEFTVFEHAPRNLGALFALAKRYDPRVQLVYEDERYTFADVRKRANNLAHHLVHEFGIGKGDRVALAMRNYPEWCFAYMAATSIGAVVVPLNAWWTGPELHYGLEDSGAKLLIADQERFDRVQLDLASLGIRALIARPSGPLPAAGFDVAPLLAGDHKLPEITVDPDDDATIMYTSGSTGHPKGVVSTHRAITSAIFTWEFILWDPLESTCRHASLSIL